MADTAVSPTDVVRQTHPAPATWLGNRSGHDSFLVEAATWLRARGLGCRHQVPPHRHPPIGPFDPRMWASVPISGTGVGGVRHGRQDTGDDSRASRRITHERAASGDHAVWNDHIAMVVGNGLSSYWTVADPYMSEWYLQ